MDFKTLQDEVSELLNFNSTQTDQDFTTTQIKKAINRAYAREYRKARQEGLRQWFSSVTEITWLSGAVTLSLPGSVKRNQISRIIDVTNSDPGCQLMVDDNGFLGDVHWKDRSTLQWGSEGPSSNRTLRVEYMAEPEEMSADDDVPELIAPDHHELIFYSAAIDLRTRADEVSPQSWAMERQELRMDFYKDVSRGRPHSTVTVIRSGNEDASEFIY
jgi:hypothetical protein